MNNRFSKIGEALKGRMPYLDGVRGIAILWVIFHNTGMHGAKTSEGFLVKVSDLISGTGWVGVQLFFVLSGFLITGILLEGLGAHNQLKNFYIRRTLRIFPLYYFFLVFFFVFLPATNLMPKWIGDLQVHQIWYWTYLINWTQPFLDKPAFGHIWSLAIEEQFYIVWPLLVILVSRRTLATVCIGLILTALIARQYIITNYPDDAVRIAYTFTITRWDALAIGALLSIGVRHQGSVAFMDKWWRYLAAVLCAGFLFQIVVNHQFAPVIGIGSVFNQTIAALLSAILVYIAISPAGTIATVVSRVLSGRTLRTLGKYSYSMYIFHIPIKWEWNSHFALDPGHYHHWAHLGTLFYNFIAILILSFLTSLLTWHLIEKHFLKLKRHFVSTKAEEFTGGRG